MSIKLKHVVLNSDVYELCFMHAGYVRNIELLGLLLGEVIEGITHIYAFCGLHRGYKDPANKIEISETKLEEVIEKAANLESTLKRPIRIVGWYHSTPLFTVWPSYLDVKVRTKYRLSDCQFVGLIFSNYSNDNPKSMQMSMTSYQASEFKDTILRRGVPLRINRVPYSAFNLCSLGDLPFQLNDVYLDMFRTCNIDIKRHSKLINGNNRMLYPVLDITHSIYNFYEATLERLRNKE